MVIIHGIYRWSPARLAFRTDYCRRCEAGTLSVLVRTFNVLHVFWVPLVPLGRWSRWLCARCGEDPHAAARTRRGFKIALVFIVALFTLAAFLTPQGTTSDLTMWIMRLGALLLLGLSVRWVVVHRPEPSFRARLALVQPYDRAECPLCRGALVDSPTGARCSACAAEHRPLRPAA